MNLNAKPLAFVDETGFIIPNPNYSKETLKNIKGRFIYTEEELKLAIAEMDRLQDARRKVADKHYGADAINAPYEIDDVDNVISDMAGERQTVPSFTAPATKRSTRGGESRKLTMPNEAKLPDSLDKEPSGVNLTDEELENYTGINKDDAVAALFGERN